MKPLLFTAGMTLIGTVGAVAVSPFWGVAVYYLFAVLRPQFIWEWTLPRGVSWSFYVAIATILATMGFRLSPPNARTTPEGEGERRSPLSGAHRLVLIFGVWIALTFVTAYNRTVSYPFFIEYLKIFVMFTVSSYAIRSVKQLWVLFLIAGVTLGYIAYEVNYLYVSSGGNFIYIYDLGYGGLDNNGAGLMLAMGVPLCYFAWEGITRWWRWVFLALVPFLLHAVLMSYSRGAMVSLIAAIPFYLLRSRRRVQLTLVLLGAAMLVPAMAGEQIRKRFFSIEQHEADESAAGRKRSWEAAWKMAVDHPFFGVGLRNADLLSESYGAGKLRTIHSQYFQTAADSGLVGLGLYLTALGSVWLNARRARRAAAGRTDLESIRVQAIASGIETAMIVFCVGGAFLSLENFELPYLMLLIGAQLPVVYQRKVEPQRYLLPGVVAGPMPAHRAQVHAVS